MDAIEAIDHIQKCNLPCLLLWETWTWKTTLVKAVAEKYWHVLTRINLNWQTGREELIGKYVLIWWETKWQEWPLLTALRQWHWILLDEINAALPEVLFTIQALTESIDWKLGNLLLAEHDWQIVIPHENCRIFGTANPSDKYVWTKAFNPATLSRFVVLNIHNLSSEDEKILLEERYPKVAKENILKLVKIWAELRKVHDEDKIDFFCSTRELVNTAALNNDWLTLVKAITIWILNKVQNKFELVDIRAILNKIVKISKEDIELEFANFVESKKKFEKFEEKMLEKDKRISDLSKENEWFKAHIQKQSQLIKEQEMLIQQARSIVEKFSKASEVFSQLPSKTENAITPSVTKNPKNPKR